MTPIQEQRVNIDEQEATAQTRASVWLNLPYCRGDASSSSWTSVAVELRVVQWSGINQ
jgi:hypothetical protein